MRNNDPSVAANRRRRKVHLPVARRRRLHPPQAPPSPPLPTLGMVQEEPSNISIEAERNQARNGDLTVGEERRRSSAQETNPSPTETSSSSSSRPSRTSLSSFRTVRHSRYSRSVAHQQQEPVEEVGDNNEESVAVGQIIPNSSSDEIVLRAELVDLEVQQERRRNNGTIELDSRAVLLLGEQEAASASSSVCITVERTYASSSGRSSDSIHQSSNAAMSQQGVGRDPILPATMAAVNQPEENEEATQPSPRHDNSDGQQHHHGRQVHDPHPDDEQEDSSKPRLICSVGVVLILSGLAILATFLLFEFHRRANDEGSSRTRRLVQNYIANCDCKSVFTYHLRHTSD